MLFYSGAIDDKTLLKTLRSKLPDYMQPRKINLEASVSGDEFLKNKGKIATFFVRVQSRQNSTWQGVFWWAEKDTETEFVSALDVLKLIDRAVTQ